MSIAQLNFFKIFYKYVKLLIKYYIMSLISYRQHTVNASIFYVNLSVNTISYK